jgi:hypothetical protein
MATDEDSHASVTALPFDMSIDMDNVAFSKFQLDSESMTNASEMGMIDMHELELLNMDLESGSQAEGQNAAGDT